MAMHLQLPSTGALGTAERKNEDCQGSKSPSTSTPLAAAKKRELILGALDQVATRTQELEGLLAQGSEAEEATEWLAQCRQFSSRLTQELKSIVGSAQEADRRLSNQLFTAESIAAHDEPELWVGGGGGDGTEAEYCEWAWFFNKDSKPAEDQTSTSPSTDDYLRNATEDDACSTDVEGKTEPSTPQARSGISATDPLSPKTLQLHVKYTFLHFQPEPTATRRTRSDPGRSRQTQEDEAVTEPPLRAESLKTTKPTRSVSKFCSSHSAGQQKCCSGACKPQEHEEAQSGTTDNIGSVGHPELCARPCIYFAAGFCANGVSCGYCHHNHEARSAHLDKRHRALLRTLPEEDRLALLLPVLRRRADVLGVREEAQELLTILKSRTAPKAPPVLASHPRFLSSVKKMSFATVLSLAVRGGRAPPQAGEEGYQGLDEAVEQGDEDLLAIRDALARLRVSVASKIG